MGRPHRRSLRLVLHEIMEPYRGEADSPRLSLFVDLLILGCLLASCALITVARREPPRLELLLPGDAAPVTGG